MDEQEGFLLCPNCGFVADEVQLVSNPMAEGVHVNDQAADGGGKCILPTAHDVHRSQHARW